MTEDECPYYVDGETKCYMYCPDNHKYAKEEAAFRYRCTSVCTGYIYDYISSISSNYKYKYCLDSCTAPDKPKPVNGWCVPKDVICPV